MDLEKMDKSRRVALLFVRLMGMLMCCGLFACLVLFYLKMLDEFLVIVIVVMISASLFMLNSLVQGIKDTDFKQRVSTMLSIIFFIAGIALIVYGFMTGKLVLKI